MKKLASKEIQRFRFIAHSLNGDGYYRPTVSYDSLDRAIDTTYSYLVRYPRESDEKYARRNQLAFFSSPLAQAVARFQGYISGKKVYREYPNEIFQAMADDIDGKGSSIDVFSQTLIKEAKARGSMLLLVDMPKAMAQNQAQQISQRIAPYWTPIYPEKLTDYDIGDDGKFVFARFSGMYTHEDGSKEPCEWYFDSEMWGAYTTEDKLIESAEHPLGECPVLIFTEGGDFPKFGSFAPIADLGKRLFNLDSELDEILRAQTFSLLTLQAPENSTAAEKMEAARVAGETIGTSNLMVHSGQQPAFIAPPDGPARIYIDRINQIKSQIDEIGLNVATVNEAESGIAMQMRFHAVNSELSAFAVRMEDFERRAWDLSAKWLGMQAIPEVEWPRDYDIADVQGELDILASMQSTNMPDAVIDQQKKRIVSVQFGGASDDLADELMNSVDERLQEETDTEEVVQPMDGNTELRNAVVRYLNNG